MYSDRRRPWPAAAAASSVEESEYLPWPALLSVGETTMPIESA